MDKKVFFIYLLVAAAVISVASNIYLVFLLSKTTQVFVARQEAQQVLAFRNMFTEKVLLANSEVDFETRLQLETAVRALNDQEIFDRWTVFTKSATKEEASFEAKNLLRVLVRKSAF